MRLTWSTMLQHNNNNNYPCLKASPREAPLKCSSASQPLPSRLELGLADLPLIRGLRAWALCSKNRQKGGTPTSGGRAPVTPPTSRRTSCPRPADVHLSWGSGYGLPQAGVGALVTVASLKTSEGNGKTQTQCLFLRNDKGSCLYATSEAGGWLRGKSGTGTGRRENISTLQTQPAASRARVRSGHRWRKSTHPVGREKRHPGGEVTEKQEKIVKAGLQRLASPEGETCQECKKPQGSSDCLQNSSNAESTRRSSHTASLDNKTFPVEKVKLRQEEPDKVYPDRLVSPEGEAFQKGRGPSESPGINRNPSNEENRRKFSHLSARNRRPSEELQHITSPDKGPRQKSCRLGESPGFLQNASNEESLRNSSHAPCQGRRLSEEDVTENQEGGNKLDLVCWASTEEVSCQKSCGPCDNSGRCGPCDNSGFLQNVSKEESLRKSSHMDSHDSRLPDEDFTDVVVSKLIKENKLDLVCQASPDKGACHKSRKLGKSSECFDNTFTEESERKSCHVACRDNRLFDEEVTDKQEESNKVNPESLTSPKWGLGQENQQLQKSPGCLPNISKEESARREGSSSGKTTEMKTDWDENAEENEGEKGLCQNDPSKCLGPNPDLESSHPHSEYKSGKDSIRCIKDPCPTGGSISQGEGVLNGGRPESEHNVANTTRKSSSSPRRGNYRGDCVEGKEADWVPNNFARGCTVTLAGPCLHTPTLAPPTSGTMATSQPCAEAEEVEKRGQEEIELENQYKKEDEEDDEFGGFIQAEGEECSLDGASSVPVLYGSSVAFDSSVVSGKSFESASGDTWTAFPQDVCDEGQDAVGQWWPDKERTDMVDHQLGLLFAAAFPILPTSAPLNPADVIPTLTQLLEGNSQEQRLLDGFRDVNKMSVHKYKRGGSGVSVSRGLLLSSLQVEQPSNESRAVNRWSNRHPSPGLHSHNRYAHNAEAKRRLSCDYNRSGAE